MHGKMQEKNYGERTGTFVWGEAGIKEWKEKENYPGKEQRSCKIDK